ncbi:serine/threonine-protein kinase [Nocardioides sp. C4-1]|uniref:serine/threonine-protein kinase n=1 Tax=Nocardioides sp. C4-1 TaxID=3151851 RepID=UPI00326667D2
MDDDLLAGRYQRLRPLGSGGMGDVWLAEDLELGRQVAVKRLRLGGDADLDGELMERMVREARTVARLNHPAIVTLFDLVRVEGRPYLILQFVEGESLADRIARERQVPWPVVARVVADVAGALAAAHAAGVTHRDVKPANLLLDRDARGHLADFGIARGVDDVAITRAGQMIGTIAFLPPEAARGEGTSPASDVWSLGATFFAAVEGHAPFLGTGQPEVGWILARLAREEAPASSRAGACTDVVAAMLASDPAVRPTTAQVAGEIERILSATPAPQPHPPSPSPSPQAERAAMPTQALSAPTRVDDPSPPLPATSSGRGVGRKLLVLLVALVAVGAVVVGLLVLGGGPDDDDRADDERTPSGPATATPVGTIDLAAGARRVELPTGAAGPLVVASTDADLVSIIDAATSEVTEVPVCDAPSGAAPTPDGTTVFVTCEGSGEVASVVDGEVRDYIDLGGTPALPRVSPDGTRLYVGIAVADTEAGRMLVIDTATDEVVGAIEADAPVGLAQFTPDGTTAYAPVDDAGAVLRIDAASGTGELVDLDGAEPNGLQVSADGSRVFVTTGTSIEVLDRLDGTDSVGASFDLGGTTIGRVRQQPGTDLGWIPEPERGRIAVLDLTTGEEVDEIAVDGRPGSIVAFAADGATAYVPVTDDDAVLAVDTVTHEVTTVAEVEAPTTIALTPDGDTLYVIGSADTDDRSRLTTLALQ